MTSCERGTIALIFGSSCTLRVADTHNTSLSPAAQMLDKLKGQLRTIDPNPESNSLFIWKHSHEADVTARKQNREIFKITWSRLNNCRCHCSRKLLFKLGKTLLLRQRRFVLKGGDMRW